MQQGQALSFSMQCAIFGFGWAAYQYLHNFVPIIYNKNRIGFWMSFIFIVSLAIGFFGLSRLTKSDWSVFFGIGVLTFCYALPFGAKMGLRFVPTLKVFVVIISWTAMAMLPLVSLPRMVFVWVSIKAALWILCLMLPFELRDLDKDALSLKTIPQLLGISGTKKLGYALLCILCFLAYQTVQITALFWVEITMLMLLGVAIKRSPKQTTLFTSFWVEGIPIVWLLGSTLLLTLY